MGGEAEIRLRGNRVTVATVRGDQVEDVRFDIEGTLPRKTIPVQIRKLEGRGYAVIQQYPRAENDYTLILRIQDRDDGSDYYRIELRW